MRVFISYRRGDSPANARLIYDHLREWFSDVFMDVEEIHAGADWLRVLEEKIAACDAMIILIGAKWLDARDAGGRRRLDDPQDFVRFEIAEALKQDKRVIPVLVDGAALPDAGSLAADLAPLARLQAIPLSHDRFEKDVETLIEALSGGLRTLDALRQAHGSLRLSRAAALLVPATALTIFFAAWVALFDALALDTRLEMAIAALGDLVVASPPANEPAMVYIEPGDRPFDRSWRHDYARLVDALASAGARRIVFDFFLAEPSAFDPPLVAAIAAARARGVDVIFGYNDLEAKRPRVAPVFAEAASGFGLACVGTRLGAASLVPLAVDPEGAKQPGLALLAAFGPGAIVEARTDLNELEYAPDRGAKGRWLRYSLTDTTSAPPADCPAITANVEYAALILRLTPLASLRARSFPLDTALAEPQRFAGKIVLVGARVAGDRMRVARGLQSEIRYGYELHADAIGNLLAGVVVHPLYRWHQFFIMLVMAALGAAIRLASRRRRLLLAGAVLAYLLVAVFVYGSLGVLLNTAYHLAALLLSFWVLGWVEGRLAIRQNAAQRNAERRWPTRA